MSWSGDRVNTVLVLIVVPRRRPATAADVALVTTLRAGRETARVGGGAT